ncbi:Fructosamine kinase-domain-containing protein [Apiospora rasikravindrae]|uniref:protein-ribulosamine 3-kinase n=1 Tax=Apiospora rasikravindrae TaxID=990691 RepID=A0ABR1SQU0_9PEZI
MSPQATDAEVDPRVLSALPNQCCVVSTHAHGASFWAKTGRIDVNLQDGTPRSFFIKAVSGEVGKNMVVGEFESMKAIHAVLPEFVPAPIAHGTYESDPETHFFLCEFRDMIEEMPEPHKFAAQLAALHQNSKSPNGRFGFHTTTYSGNLPQVTDWEDSWEVFFTKGLKQALGLEREAKRARSRVGRLTAGASEGRSLKPCLVHGDLWYANSGIDVDTDRCLIFDACCFYAHNEYEFGQWMPVCNKFGAEYLAAYHSYVQISDPAEDYEGRLDLYKLRFNAHVPALFKDNPSLREQMLGDIRDLVARYGSQAEKIPNSDRSHNL